MPSPYDLYPGFISHFPGRHTVQAGRDVPLGQDPFGTVHANTNSLWFGPGDTAELPSASISFSSLTYNPFDDPATYWGDEVTLLDTSIGVVPDTALILHVRVYAFGADLSTESFGGTYNTDIPASLPFYGVSLGGKFHVDVYDSDGALVDTYEFASGSSLNVTGQGDCATSGIPPFLDLPCTGPGASKTSYGSYQGQAVLENLANPSRYTGSHPIYTAYGSAIPSPVFGLGGPFPDRARIVVKATPKIAVGFNHSPFGYLDQYVNGVEGTLYFSSILNVGWARGFAALTD